MPPLIPWLIAGAGLVAGARWLARHIAIKAEDARVTAEELRKRASEEARAPRDLGDLDFDPLANVYRSRSRRN